MQPQHQMVIFLDCIYFLCVIYSFFGAFRTTKTLWLEFLAGFALFTYVMAPRLLWIYTLICFVAQGLRLHYALTRWPKAFTGFIFSLVGSRPFSLFSVLLDQHRSLVWHVVFTCFYTSNIPFLFCSLTSQKTDFVFVITCVFAP